MGLELAEAVARCRSLAGLSASADDAAAAFRFRDIGMASGGPEDTWASSGSLCLSLQSAPDVSRFTPVLGGRRFEPAALVVEASARSNDPGNVGSARRVSTGSGLSGRIEGELKLLFTSATK